jgi:hypothetical protein
MKLKLDDDEAERITLKTLKRTRKFLKSAEGTNLGWPDDQELIDAIDHILMYYE